MNNHLSSTDSAQLLEDAFGRKHDYLRISLTERCNLRCFYCMPPEGIPLRDKAHFMSSEEIVAISTIFTQLGVKKIRLTGGEPLIRKDARNILLKLGELPVELAITTNGILVDQFIDTFKKAGIRSVNVSLDSLNKERQEIISRRNFFDRIMNNINLLLKEGFVVKVNVVVMNGVNVSELIEFIELTKSHSLHIRFIEFMPFSGNKWKWTDGIGYEKMMDTIYAHYGRTGISKRKDKPNDTAKCYTVDGYSGSFGIISSITHPFCASCNRIRVTADGKMKNCLFSAGETDLLTAFRKGKNILPLISTSIKAKKEKRGGLTSLEDLKNVELIEKNRSMVSIGG